MKTIIYNGKDTITIENPETKSGTDCTQGTQIVVSDSAAVKICKDCKDFTIQETQTANSGDKKGK